MQRVEMESRVDGLAGSTGRLADDLTTKGSSAQDHANVSASDPSIHLIASSFSGNSPPGLRLPKPHAAEHVGVELLELECRIDRFR